MAIYGRFLVDGEARYALIDGETARFVDSIFGKVQITGETSPVEGLEILPPVVPSKLMAIGLNYADHAKESGLEVPKVPLMWIKATSSIIAHNEVVEIAYPEHRTDYECELAVVIGKRAKRVSEENAADYILGYTLSQDISDRDIQWSESQWTRAKSFDTYAPLGPFIYTDVDPSHLPIQTLLNGEVVQNSNTEQLIFNPAQLIAFLSAYITLEPGDVIITGTPFGIAPIKSGDVIETRIGDMKPLVNPVKNAGR